MIGRQLRMGELEHRFGFVSLGRGNIAFEHFRGFRILSLLKQCVAAEEDGDSQIIRLLSAGVDCQRMEDLDRFGEIAGEILALSLTKNEAALLLWIGSARGKRCEDA